MNLCKRRACNACNKTKNSVVFGCLDKTYAIF